jgi:hypothetical protein
MLFFLIVPIWLFVVLCAVVLLFLPQHRRKGLYALSVSTLATLTSFVISTAVLFIAPRIDMHPSKWTGLIVMGIYLLSVGVGALIGGIGGFFLVRKLTARTLPG